METSVLIAGFGGQGIMLLGQMLGISATRAGLFATFFPDYGPEQRGGTASCSVVLGDEQIGTPVVTAPDTLIAMNEPSLMKYGSQVKAGGTILENSSLIQKQVKVPQVKVFPIPASQIAAQIGSDKIANMVFLGAYVQLVRILPESRVIEIIHAKLDKKPELLEFNLAAFEAGKQVVKKFAGYE